MNKKYHLLEKLKNVRRDQWIVLLLAGVLLIVISLPVENGAEEEAQAETEAEGGTQESVYEMERRLEDILSKLDGAGKVSVMIHWQESGEKIVEKDTASVSRTTQEDGDGTARSTLEEEARPETVYGKSSGGSETPYVTKELTPQIAGVLVLAQGADSAVVKKDITDAVMALFGLEAHKIKVMKMN